MKPLTALLRETWWLWAGCLIAAGLMVALIDLFFLVLFPMLTVVYFYFAYVRFDRNGQPRDF